MVVYIDYQLSTGNHSDYFLSVPKENGLFFGHVHYAIEYLRNPDVYRLGKRLAIIGAGNVAMDVARTAFRQGCEQVYIICNMDESCITARDIETEYAKIDGDVLQNSGRIG